MYKFLALRNMVALRTAGGQLKARPYSKETEPQYIVVRSPEFDEKKNTTGFVRYEKRVGESVTEEDVVAEIDTDLYAVSVYSPVRGIIDKIYAPEGTKVRCNQGMFRIRQDIEIEEPVRYLKKLQKPRPIEDIQKIKSSDTLVGAAPGNKKIPINPSASRVIQAPLEYPEQSLPKVPNYTYIAPDELSYRRMLAKKRREEEEATD